MIFCAKNEDDVPTWKLVLEGKKTVTRRLKPMFIGKKFAIQSKRGGKAIARGQVIDCWNSKVHEDYFFIGIKGDFPTLRYWEVEAEKEGFKTWQYLFYWFEKHDIDIYNTYRIEFEVIERYV